MLIVVALITVALTAVVLIAVVLTVVGDRGALHWQWLPALILLTIASWAGCAAIKKVEAKESKQAPQQEPVFEATMKFPKHPAPQID